MGALVFLVLLGDHRWKAKLKPSARRQKLIYTDATFSFSQSWATSIAGLLTIVATVFSTTGVLASLIPGVDSGFFLAVTIVYGMVLALAPLVYSTLQGSEGDHSHSYGTRRGFVIAATITGVAVGGQLSTLGAIIALSDLSFSLRVTIIALIAVVAGLIIAYTAATRRQLWRLPKPTIHSTTNRPALADRRPALP
jgi:hypothetical protein